MDLIQAVILGILQGIFEWLPISSQGQVAVVAMQIFGIASEDALKYAIFLHIGTLISATIYFRKEIAEILKLRERKFLKFIVIALIATAITAIPSYLLLREIAQSSFWFMIMIGTLLIVTGIVQKINKKHKEAQLDSKNALFLGLGQGFSVLPGVSRSGTTTSVILFEGFKPEDAFRISFLLSIPAVFLGELAFGIIEGVIFEVNVLIAVVVAAVVGYFSIDLLLKSAKRINFSLFCIVFGIIYLGLAFL